MPSDSTHPCERCGSGIARASADGLCPACCLESALLDPGADAVEAVELGSFGDYDLLDVLARGGMGVVFRARHRTLGRVVALKKSRRRVSRARPRCGVFARRRKRRRGSITRAVQYAHERGVLHRDLKPANILLDAAGEPGVADLGLALRADAATRLTLTGAALGTPDYMAPEQAAGNTRRTTTAADLYSLSAILYEWLTGRTPFAAPTPLKTMRRAPEHAEPARGSRS